MKFLFKNLYMIMILLFVISCASTATHPRKLIAEKNKEFFAVKGEVLWTGPTPTIYPIPTIAYRGACGQRRAVVDLELKKSRLWYKRLLNVAVWLEPLWDETNQNIHQTYSESPAPHPDVIEIEETGCEFKPRLSIIPVGSRIKIVNKDRTDHWFVIEGDDKKAKQFVQLYGKSPSVFTFETPGVHHRPLKSPITFKAEKVDKWRLHSGLHRWMDAWVVITDKVWFDKVDDDGYFKLDNVPKGAYRLHTWHPVLGPNSVIIRVPDDTRQDVSVSYKEIPEDVEDISSTVISTPGEVWEDRRAPSDMDEDF